MNRIVARFDDEDDAEAAEDALREAELEPEQPQFDNPMFNPVARVPEARGLKWGSVLGGIVGLVIISLTYLNLFLVPRLSPMMSADPLSLLFLGFGVGAIVGGFIGGAIGTLRPISEPEGPEVAVNTPDNRVDEVEELLRGHGATAVNGNVTYHENPGKWSKK